MYVVAIGDAFEGTALYGPFPEFMDAYNWVENFRPSSWTIVEVEAVPAEVEVK